MESNNTRMNNNGKLPSISDVIENLNTSNGPDEMKDVPAEIYEKHTLH